MSNRKRAIFMANTGCGFFVGDYVNFNSREAAAEWRAYRNGMVYIPKSWR